MDEDPQPAAAEQPQQQQQQNLASYVKWVRSISRKLLTSKPGSDARAKLLSDAASALFAKADAFVLSHQEWQWLTALKLADLRSSPVTPASAQEALDLHLRASLESGASHLHIPALARYASLVLSWHSAYAALELHRPDADDEGEGSSSRASQVQDALADWTGITGGPLARSDPRGKLPAVEYESSTLPAVPISSGDLDWEAVLGEDATRERLREVYSRAAGNWAEGHLVWDQYLTFELSYLARDKRDEARVEAVRQVYVARLASPHKNAEATFQAFSSFVSTYLPPDAYESTMSASQKAYSSAKARYSSVERYEDSLVMADRTSYTSWKAYLAHVTSASTPQKGPPKGKAAAAAAAAQAMDIESAAFFYERAIAEIGLATTASPDGDGPPNLAAEDAERKRKSGLKRDDKRDADKAETEALKTRRGEVESCWVSYVSLLNAPRAPHTLLIDACTRAVKALPASGILWAQLMRAVARIRHSKPQVEEAFSQALSSGDVQAETSALVDLLVGRIDAERELVAASLAAERGLEVGDALAELRNDPDRFMEVYGFLSVALDMLGKQRQQDASLRLERLTTSWLESGGENFAPFAESIWDNATKTQGTNVHAWLEAARFHSRRGNAKKARSQFKMGLSRVPEADAKSRLLEEWVAFEHVWGGMQEVEHAEQRQRQERDRLWEEWYQGYAAQQAEYNAQVAAAAAANGAEANDADMGDVSMASDAGGKRKAAGSGAQQNAPVTQGESSTKKGRGETTTNKPTRDRENCSILVANLSLQATEEDLVSLFSDCGSIEEISGPRQLSDGTAAAVVEFSDRSAVPAARTKDRKRVGEAEISVILGWETTLYVTNFPEEMDDSAVKQLFSIHGTIFNVRWPSKRFDNSRRFCYVQFTSKAAAQSALSEHTRQLTPLHTLQVLLSDPSRRRTRTDANADDRELFVTGLPRWAKPEEVRALFEACGDVEGFRMPVHPDGKAKGLAFVDMRTPLEAQKAVTQLKGAKVQGKEIAVSFAVKKGGAGNAGPVAGRGKAASPAASTTMSLEKRLRCVKLSNLPPDAQEALIQQMVEGVTGLGSVNEVEWTPATGGHTEDNKGIAIVELKDAATAGRLALVAQLKYEERDVAVSSLESRGAAAKMSHQQQHGKVGEASFSSTKPTATTPDVQMGAPTAFMPRAARGRGRGRVGLGFARSQPRPAATATASGSGGDEMDIDGSGGGSASATASKGENAKPKGQDAFRSMLQGN